jgi:hypothetical protein
VAILLSIAIALFSSAGPLTGTAAATTPVNTTPPAEHDSANQTSQVNRPQIDPTPPAWVGNTLTVTQAAWPGSDPGTTSDIWDDCDASGQNCSWNGATGTSYTLKATDAGHTIVVMETAKYATIATAPISSPPTALVTNPLPVADANNPPMISGTAQQDQTLTASPGNWANNPTSYNYQWQDCDSGGNDCTAITGATGPAYTLTAADVGGTVVVSVNGVNAAGTGAAAPSAPTTLVQTASTISLAAAPSAPVTNQAVTLAATVTSRAAAGAPSGSVAFLDRGKAISGCGAVPVPPSGQSATVLCQTSFGAGSAQLTAAFTPAVSSVVLGSASSGQTLNVGKDIPTTTLDASSQVQVGAATTYTVTVAPAAARSGPVQPTGEVEFLDGGEPIARCTAQPLVGGGATCSIKYSATGSRSVVARYLGDSNFAGSSSLAAAVRIATLPVKGTITATMQWTFSYAPTYTRVISMVINGVPTGATVQMVCRGRGCPFAKRNRTIGKPKPCTGKAKRTHSCPVHGRINLTGTFRRRNLRPGTQITIEIRRPRFVGKYYSFTVRSRKQPRVQIACLAAANGTRPNVGC